MTVHVVFGGGVWWNVRAGILRIASSEGLGTRLHAILASYRASHPQTIVELSSAPTPTNLRLVTAGDLDAAFVRAASATAGVTVHHLWDEPLLLTVPTERANTAGDLRALADLPLARADRDDNPGVFDLITRACRTAGFDPRPGPRLASVQDILAGPIAAGECWTLLYASTAPHDSTSVNVLPPVPAPRAVGLSGLRLKFVGGHAALAASDRSCSSIRSRRSLRSSAVNFQSKGLAVQL